MSAPWGLNCFFFIPDPVLFSAISFTGISCPIESTVSLRQALGGIKEWQVVFAKGLTNVALRNWFTPQRASLCSQGDENSSTVDSWYLLKCLFLWSGVPSWDSTTLLPPLSVSLRSGLNLFGGNLPGQKHLSGLQKWCLPLHSCITVGLWNFLLIYNYNSSFFTLKFLN